MSSHVSDPWWPSQCRNFAAHGLGFDCRCHLWCKKRRFQTGRFSTHFLAFACFYHITASRGDLMIYIYIYTMYVCIYILYIWYVFFNSHQEISVQFMRNYVSWYIYIYDVWFLCLKQVKPIHNDLFNEVLSQLQGHFELWPLMECMVKPRLRGSMPGTSWIIAGLYAKHM